MGIFLISNGYAYVTKKKMIKFSYQTKSKINSRFQVFDKEDDDGRYVNDDNLSDIKEDLVDEAREDQKQTGSDGGKSDSDDKGKTYTPPR